MNEIDALKISISILTANLALLQGKPPATYLGVLLPVFDSDAAERQRLSEIADRIKLKPWQDWMPGTPPDQVGDNDKPDDDFLRAFEPMMRHAGMAHNSFKDSTGEVFFFPNIKKRTPGEGWMGVKRECLRMIESEWGQSWMAHPDNIKAGNLVPSTAAVMLLIKQVGSNKLPA